MASTLQGTDEDVNQAVAAAKSSFDSWSKTPGHVRSRILYRCVHISSCVCVCVHAHTFSFTFLTSQSVILTVLHVISRNTKDYSQCWSQWIMASHAGSLGMLTFLLW